MAIIRIVILLARIHRSRQVSDHSRASAASAWRLTASVSPMISGHIIIRGPQGRAPVEEPTETTAVWPGRPVFYRVGVGLWSSPRALPISHRVRQDQSSCPRGAPGDPWARSRAWATLRADSGVVAVRERKPRQGSLAPRCAELRSHQYSHTSERLRDGSPPM